LEVAAISSIENRVCYSVDEMENVFQSASVVVAIDIPPSTDVNHSTVNVGLIADWVL